MNGETRHNTCFQLCGPLRDYVDSLDRDLYGHALGARSQTLAIMGAYGVTHDELPSLRHMADAIEVSPNLRGPRFRNYRLALLLGRGVTA